MVADQPSQLAFYLLADARRDIVAAAREDPRATELLKAYTTRLVKQRLHQDRFRYLVLAAYRRQCAMCRLRHRFASRLPPESTRVHGEWHALIHKDIPRIRNVGFIVGDGFFHPGDALTDPGTHVKLLACPLNGLYTKDGTTVDWIRQLAPAQVAPVHDSGLIPLAQTTLDQFFGPNPGIGPGTGAPYFRPVPGIPFPL